ncbi:multiple sugar transport system substrate-binding protein [Anaerocolumna jejuensis DSM 15929]|uniref:Multiple sugar transport system substrate-binding protein n=1 Tax=Anaerocolumna jejuensis DSM 15929 TaxID=1121322 RepID=A0A1M6QVP2_9FIRM|nr:ABC transporter substrate-binding protein [Anaerocolumna jejuensis]SHK24127.1 multiple sugar transport system substrate-binding protein [Anaerocolumna jejuensis DSM 15929]
MKKKLLSVLLCVAMTASLLSGCGKNNETSSADTTKETNNGSKEDSSGNSSDTGSSKYKKFITVDVFDSQSNYQGIQSGWFAKVVKDKFNMELNIIAPNVAGGGETLYQTRSAAGDLGDLIFAGSDQGKLQDLVTAGLVMDMTDLLKNEKNVTKYQSAIDTTNDLVKEDGTYAIPSAVSSQTPDTPSEGLDLNYGPYVRWDAYSAVGYPEIKTLEDLLPVLQKMQQTVTTSDTGKKTYAFSFFKDWDGNMMNNAKQPTCLYGYDELGFVLAKADGSDYQSIIDSDSMYTRVLKLYFDANQMGLVDPESTTQNYDTLYNKYKDGQVLYSPWPWLGKGAYNTNEHKADGKGFMIAPIDDMKVFSYGCQSTGNPKFTVSIGSKAEDPQRLADFIDWLFSPEGICMSSSQTSGSSGPKDLTWELKDGKPVLTDFGKTALVNGDATMPDSWGGGSWKDGISQLNFQAVNLLDINPETGSAYTHTVWDSFLEMNKTKLDTDWQDKMKAKTTLEYLQNNDKILVAPGSGYSTPLETSDITTLRNQCKAAIVQYSWQMIFAKDKAKFDSLLKEMQDTVDGLGYAEVLKLDMKNAKDQDAARKAALAASK